MDRSGGAKSAAVLVSGIGVAIILCIAGVTAIAAPKFMRFQDRSQQSECRSQLKAIATAERAYYAEHDQYSAELSAMDVIIRPGSQYRYTVALKGSCPSCEVTAGCEGNLDSDDTLDQWKVTVIADKPSESGEVIHVVDDIQQ